ncbi:MAG: beta-galactosidase [Bowdeniella nasicola]|nr:beta-galactosidase [Bowdeniella nasicola]
MLHYGADYNPEQWSAATITDDIALMREAGVTMVSLGIFSWSKIEVTEGEFDFTWLDAVIDQLYQAGISIDLATATASPPPWLATNHPETLPVTQTGVRLGVGSRQHYCPSSPIFRHLAARMAGKMAARYGKHPAVKMWHISNEYGCHISRCYCEVSARDFRRWLEEKYGDISQLNDAWGTAFWSQHYPSFAHINPPAAMPTLANPAQEADFAAFSDDALLQCYLGEKQAIREYSDLPVTTNFMGLFEPTNYRRWAKHIDIISDDSYPNPAAAHHAREAALSADLMRSLKDGQPFMLLEQTTAMVQWRERNVRKRPGVFALESLQRVAHGADAIMQFQWRQSIRGAETFHSAMVPHAGRDSRTWTEVVELGAQLKKLAPVAGTRVNSPVAIVMDWPSQWQREAAIGPGPNQGWAAIRRWHATCFEAGVSVDFAFADSDLNGYRIIVVPEYFAMSAKVASNLIAAAKRGAHILVTAPTAVTDETGCAYQGGYGAVLEELTGVRVVDHYLPGGSELHEAQYWDAIDARVDRISAAISTPDAIDTLALHVDETSPLARVLDRMCRPRPQLHGRAWAELLSAQSDVEVLAEFTHGDLAGKPAITYRRCATGGGTYIATDGDAALRAAVLRLAAARARLPLPGVGLPSGVEVAQRGGFTFVLNHGDRAAQLRGFCGTDLLTGTTATGHLVLPPRSAAVIAAED